MSKSENKQASMFHLYGITKLRYVANALGIARVAKYKVDDKDELVSHIIHSLNLMENLERDQMNTRIDKILGVGTSVKDKWVRIKMLGHPGKEGITYLVVNDKGQPYAMKTFKESKSAKRIMEEKDLQVFAAKYDISPKVIEYDIDHKYIVMEMMDKTLLQLITEKGGRLTRTLERELYELFVRLDNCGIYHNDANPLNVMIGKDKKLYMIDYGFGKFMNKGEKLNTQLMTPGIVIWMKKFYPNIHPRYLISQMSDKIRTQLSLNSSEIGNINIMDSSSDSESS
jgi:predicted Ser/Thr protein kinase